MRFGMQLIPADNKVSMLWGIVVWMLIKFILDSGYAGKKGVVKNIGSIRNFQLLKEISCASVFLSPNAQSG
jgi:hypothetical protein